MTRLKTLQEELDHIQEAYNDGEFGAPTKENRKRYEKMVSEYEDAIEREKEK